MSNYYAIKLVDRLPDTAGMHPTSWKNRYQDTDGVTYFKTEKATMAKMMTGGPAPLQASMVNATLLEKWQKLKALCSILDDKNYCWDDGSSLCCNTASH